MVIEATDMHFTTLNDMVRGTEDPKITIEHCIGQRYIGAGLDGKEIRIEGTPGNALGAYLNGCEVTVYGNAQDATGDTMNSGRIIVHGSAGDATGYAMRGGRIFIRDNVGYRCGIHMKAYKENKPAIVIGGRTGSFLGEYQAGGTLIVLGLHTDGLPVIGHFCGTGMHGGEIYVRCAEIPFTLPKQVKAERIERLPEGEVAGLLREWCRLFGRDAEELTGGGFFRITPNTDNPYKSMYVNNR